MSSTIPDSMYAWRKHRGNPEPVWEQVAVPKPSANEVLVKLIASGVCRSDLSLLQIEKQAGWFREKYILGHEGCGEIVKFGESAAGMTSLKLGDIVALHAVPGCQEEDCPECSRDLSQCCERGHHSGIGQDGFYAPYAVVDVRGAVLVPQGVSPAQAAVATDAINTAYHGIVRRAEVKPHETVFLFGLGGLGMNALQVVRHIGARVIVLDTRQSCLDTAKSLGVPADDIVPLSMGAEEFLRNKGPETRIDTVLEFVGKHETFEAAQQIVRRGGKILCVGTLDADNTIHMKIGTRKRLSFIFTYGGQAGDLKEVLDLVAAGAIKPQVEERSLDSLPEALKGLAAGEVDGRVALMHK
ncbi:hypothetical protein KVR01_007235 [Diaporthe batatas]|uniref:uncharacterized protein n=1 Tax=Diaporthe batatas TaxID=748121 RepID=UPI001D04818A|nr:uncharacterized protein KVR01_007235 [Diaporthe batatas]KAG8162757.1 hypothetical protein KVR01_007235 [Diaporthe batatas]